MDLERRMKMAAPITLRPYREEDSPVLARLFYHTVHRVNGKDYSPRQLAAWAPAPPPTESWHRSFVGHLGLVALQEGEIVGFGDADPQTGYLDRLYVRWDKQGQGIGTLLCRALEQACTGPVVYTYASLSAQSFFAHRGYRLVYRQQVERRGVLLENARMEKAKNRPE